MSIELAANGFSSDFSSVTSLALIPEPATLIPVAAALLLVYLRRRNQFDGLRDLLAVHACRCAYEHRAGGEWLQFRFLERDEPRLDTGAGDADSGCGGAAASLF